MVRIEMGSLRFYTAPEDQGQMQEFSYAAYEDGIVERFHDRSDGEESYRFAPYEAILNGDFEPWNRSPEVREDAWRAVRCV
jgi:hypothetical protein